MSVHRPDPHVSGEELPTATQQFIGRSYSLASRKPRPERLPVTVPHPVLVRSPYLDDSGEHGDADIV